MSCEESAESQSLMAMLERLALFDRPYKSSHGISYEPQLTDTDRNMQGICGRQIIFNAARSEYEYSNLPTPLLLIVRMTKYEADRISRIHSRCHFTLTISSYKVP